MTEKSTNRTNKTNMVKVKTISKQAELVMKLTLNQSTNKYVENYVSIPVVLLNALVLRNK